MKEYYYIKFKPWDQESLNDAIAIAEKLWYIELNWARNKMRWQGILLLIEKWYYNTTTFNENVVIDQWYKEIKLYDKLEPWTKVEVISDYNWTKWNIYTIHYCIENCFDKDMWYLYSMKETHYTFYSENIKTIQSLKIWDYVRIRKCKTVYIITDILWLDKVKIKDISSWNIYNTELSKLELDLYLNEAKSSIISEWSIFKMWDLIKAWNAVYKVTSDTNVAFNINTWIKIEIGNNTNFKLYKDKELVEQVNYHFDNDWNEKQRQALNVKENNLKTNVLTDEQTNILINNNNTMEKLNQLRADKFFANEKNLTAIESLDTLLKDAIELVKATKKELDKTEIKLCRLSWMLDLNINNQDVATIKNLISSTKVIQEFVDELRWKTISKFENAKTKFDIVGYLKD